MRIVPVSRPVSELIGLLERPKRPPASVEEMDRVIAEETAREHEGVRER